MGISWASAGAAPWWVWAGAVGLQQSCSLSCAFPTLERCAQWQSPGLAAGDPRECFHSVWEGTCTFSQGHGTLGL